jgi:ribonuclease P protein component
MPGKPDQRLGRKRRLTRTSHFQQAYAQGRRWIGRHMVLWLREGEGAALRLGVVAGRKVGPAVQRARAKRLLREAYRLNRYRFDGLCDVVLIARRSILEAKWTDVVDELLDLAGRAGLTPEDRGQESEVRREHL